ncbi:MAG: transcription elongation factor GreA [Acidimicrobiia bacterium]
MDATHLSPQAYQRLAEELHELTTTRRKEISEWLERAREHGDIRENADYDAAKNAQGLSEARIRQIEALLKRAVVVGGLTGDRVEAGTLVEVRMEGDDETSTYLVGSIEEKGRGYDVISPGSPLGKALLGHAAGEVVSYAAPGGSFDVEIVAVRAPD